MPGAMTMVKSRTAPTEEAISFPVLTYSDADPRTDLRHIDEKLKYQQNQQSLAQFEFPRPHTGDTRSNRKAPPGTIATFDFRVTAPPDEVVPSHAKLDRSPIGVGIALGSPGMVDSKENLPPPRFNTNIFAGEQKEQTQPTRKASKWKKIGGLFRAKSALASPTRPRPFPHGVPSDAPPNEKQKQQNALTEEWPRIETDQKGSTTKTASTPSRTRKFSFSNKRSPKEKNGEHGPRLEVDIPDVQMERYSVMFSHVMNKNQRPSLLARRSKTLDNLHVPQNSVSTRSRISGNTVLYSSILVTVILGIPPSQDTTSSTTTSNLTCSFKLHTVPNLTALKGCPSAWNAKFLSWTKSFAEIKYNAR